MKKVSIIGHFGGNRNFVDGQTIKTKMLTEELIKLIGQENIDVVDTYMWKQNPLRLLLKCNDAIKVSDNIIILTAHNGVKVIIPLLVLLNKIYKKKIHYSVIGGWLPLCLEKNKWLIRYIERLFAVYVETNIMKKKLVNIGLNNVVTMPNFKRLDIIKKNNIYSTHRQPYKLCTFSRINRQKGIEDLCKVLDLINKENDKNVYILDVYGPIESDYKEKFDQIKEKYKGFMKYKGIVDSSNSVEVISSYYLLLFPTKYKTEGIPGTILDAYASGTPVLASRWDSCEEIIIENITGITYEFDNLYDLKNKLELIHKENTVEIMRKNCIVEAQKYKPEKVINIIVERLD